MAKKAARKSRAGAPAPERVISPILGCTPKRLPQERIVAAATHARQINPQNFAPIHNLTRVMPGFAPDASRLAVVTTKYWGSQGVRLSVGFLDGANPTLRRLILEHMNAWSRTANVKFMETSDSFSARVRISRMGGANGGYWSYVGTDIDLIPPGEPTMNLEGFTEHTLEAEFRRVVRHETGHTLGFPHEHMRGELVARIDEDLAIEYFGRTQGWSPAEVRQQVLTPLEDGSILGTPNPDPFSIMCYQISGEITIDGQPIIGGTDIDEEDRQFAARIYPKPPQALTEEEPVEMTPDSRVEPRGTGTPEWLVASYLATQRLQAENLAALLASQSSRDIISRAPLAAPSLPDDIPLSTKLSALQVFDFLKALISGHFGRSTSSFDGFTQLVAAEGDPIPITPSAQRMADFTKGRMSHFFHCQPKLVFGDTFKGNLVSELAGAVFANRNAQ